MNPYEGLNAGDYRGDTFEESSGICVRMVLPGQKCKLPIVFSPDGGALSHDCIRWTRPGDIELWWSSCDYSSTIRMLLERASSDSL